MFLDPNSVWQMEVVAAYARGAPVCSYSLQSHACSSGWPDLVPGGGGLCCTGLNLVSLVCFCTYLWSSVLFVVVLSHQNERVRSKNVFLVGLATLRECKWPPSQCWGEVESPPPLLVSFLSPLVGDRIWGGSSKGLGSFDKMFCC